MEVPVVALAVEVRGTYTVLFSIGINLTFFRTLFIILSVVNMGCHRVVLQENGIFSLSHIFNCVFDHLVHFFFKFPF